MLYNRVHQMVNPYSDGASQARYGQGQTGPQDAGYGRVGGWQQIQRREHDLPPLRASR